MHLLRTACLLLAALCVCTLGQTEIPQGNVGVSTPVTTLTSVSEAVSEAVSMSSSQVTSLQPSVLANTAAKATTTSVTTGSMPSSTTAKQGTTEGTTVTTVQQTTAPTLAARNEDDNTTSTAQVNGTQATQNESVGALSTKRWPLPPTTSPQKKASSETSSLHVITLTEITLTEPSNVVVTESSPGNTKMQEGIIRYSNVILPVVITLIVITFSVFSLVALYRICHKKAPERQENGTEQAQLDKEGVKLLSVKITTPETGEYSSQGKNRTQQCNDSSSHLSNNYV